MNNMIITLAKGIVGESNVKTDEPMSSHTTFRVGGAADLYITPQNESQLASLIKLFRQFKVEFHVIGNGSNLLVGDRGVRGAVIEIGRNLSSIEVSKNMVTAQSGVLLSRLANSAAGNGLAGLEFASGIPGSFGGAIYMNAGAYGGEMKDIITEVVYLDANCKICTVKPAKTAVLATERVCLQTVITIILRGTLRLQTDEIDEIKARMQELTRRRVEKQPVDKASAGSTFKRPEGYYAAALIEESGLKGYSHGGASVSEKHAGFVVNNGNATAEDVRNVIKHVQKTVKEKFGVDLNTEVKFLGEF